MSLLCRIGMHKWKGCKCDACGKTRNQDHDWSKDCEKCSHCGQTRTNSHKWSGCKCSTCGKTRDESHTWSSCKCSECGKGRDEEHDWSKDCEKCAICGATRKDCHRLQGCKCIVCGSEIHDWTAGKKIAPIMMSRTCRRCGKEDRSVILDPSDPNSVDAIARLLFGR